MKSLYIQLGRAVTPILICIIVLFFHAAPARCADRPSYTGEPATIAHDFLELEKDFGAGPAHRAALNGLLNRSFAAVTVRQSYTTEEAVQTMLEIDALLKKEGFVFANNYLLSTGIETKKIDCDNYCALYIAIAEVLKIPVIPVYAPNHSFLRFYFDDGSYLNWEPLEAAPLQDAFYIKKMRIPEQSLRKGVYLKSLTRKDASATFLGGRGIGAWLLSRTKYRESLPYFSSAVETNPLFSSAWHNRGTAYYALKRLGEAENDLVKANELDPSRPSTHNTLGDIYFDVRNYERALDEYKKSIKLDTQNYVPYYSIGLIMKTLGKEEQGREWLQKADEIRKMKGR